MLQKDPGFPFTLSVNGVQTHGQVKEARSFWLRLRGLLFRPPLRTHQALWIIPCNAIHMLGMRYPIDVVFLDAEGWVLQVKKSVTPGRAASCRGAKSVLELAEGGCEAFGIDIGTKIGISPPPPVLIRQ